MQGNGHRWVFVPIVLALALMVGILYVSQNSSKRLEAAAERVRVAEVRQTRLAEYLLLVTETETGERGYLLTRRRQYLIPYERAVSELPLKLQALLDDYREHGPEADIEKLEWLDGLTAGKLREIGDTLDLFRRRGLGTALSVVRTEFGRKSMDQIREVISALQTNEALAVEEAAAAWRRELWVGRALILLVTVLDMLLVIVASLLILRDQRRRVEHARELEQQNAELDAKVRRRTEALSNLTSELQRVTETEKRALARELHDELGSLLIAAKMDISWLRRKLPSDNPDIQLRWDRVLAGLDDGVNLKRRVVESLRPTLLDNLGLVAALQWLLEQTCRRAGIRYTERYPKTDLRLTDDASIAVFRVVQEALTNIVRHSGAKDVELTVDLTADTLALTICDNGKGIAADRISNVIGSHGLASMQHRVVSLGGEWKIRTPEGGGTLISARFPLANVLLTDEAAA